MKALAFSGGKDSMACLHLLRDELDCAIYVDTGFSYPETRALVDYAATLIPMHLVKSQRQEQNDAHGLPSDLVPVDWTREGQTCTVAKPTTIQSYSQCCLQNIGLPLFMRAKELGVTEIFYGQRKCEKHRAPVSDGAALGSITRRHPIEDWSDEQVFDFLASKMEVPAHYKIKHSSLDCYDCPAYRADSRDRLEWTKRAHPLFFARYEVRKAAVDEALCEAMQSWQ